MSTSNPVTAPTSERRPLHAASERSQIVLIWVAVVLAIIFGVTLFVLLRMIPPPSATWTADQIKAWYVDRQTEIRIGATIASWTSAFMVPLWCVVAIQISRQERGRPIWTAVALVAGSLVSIFLVLPPLFFGAAAFAPDRAAEITAMMHQLGVLTLVTTDQYYVFPWAAIIVTCLSTPRSSHSPFPRWFGYFSLWFAVVGECGAIAYNSRSGPFAWNGLLSFWIPFGVFAPWLAILVVLLLRSLKRQLRETLDQAAHHNGQDRVA